MQSSSESASTPAAASAVSAVSDSSPSVVWKNPSTAAQAKYNLVALPTDVIGEGGQPPHPTVEESTLLQMYESIKSFERQAARLKEVKAREKLEAKEAEFKQRKQQEQQKERSTVRRKKKKDKLASASATVGAAEAESDYASEDDENGGSDIGTDNEDVDRDESLQMKREAKLEKWRDEIESKQQAMAEQENKEIAMRNQLLTQNDAADIGTTLKRKRLDQNLEDGSALLTSLIKAQTPPHEFSKTLGFSAVRGKVLFPTSLEEPRWTPPETAVNPNDGAFLVELDNFDIGKAVDGRGNNTVAIKFNAPGDSKRFSINIAGPNHNEFDSVLLHFNPRQFERGGQLVINDKQSGIWGQAVNLPLSQVPLMFGQTSTTLQIQITGEGFDLYIEDQHCARLEHRIELPSKPCSLYLQFPSSDDYGSPENWIVYKAWWGNKAIMAKGDVAGIPGVNSFNAMHPRKLFISGLSKLQIDSDVDVRRAELERAFRKYGGAQGVTCIVPKNTTFAFVEMENERQADLALSEMSSKYKMNRARWTRHEALQEKRAKEEANKQGNAANDSSSAW